MSLAPRATGSTEGERTAGDLRIGTESDNMVAFGDGIETDRLTLTWRQIVSRRRGTDSPACVLDSPDDAVTSFSLVQARLR